MTQFQLGVNDTALGATFAKIIVSQEACANVASGLIFANISAGTMLQVRAKSASSYPQAYDAAVYAVC
jgi:hypothetical protein